ncbi:hypothetical protein EDB83DRAFT_2554971 [Lactarius deliciosus]|nr:hypothetical protein EDB83DRAFT_2554971 [Lactarius deliciosus]
MTTQALKAKRAISGQYRYVHIAAKVQRVTSSQVAPLAAGTSGAYSESSTTLWRLCERNTRRQRRKTKRENPSTGFPITSAGHGRLPVGIRSNQAQLGDVGLDPKHTRKLLRESAANTKLLHLDERPEKFLPRYAVDLIVLPFFRHSLLRWHKHAANLRRAVDLPVKLLAYHTRGETSDVQSLKMTFAVRALRRRGDLIERCDAEPPLVMSLDFGDKAFPWAFQLEISTDIALTTRNPEQTNGQVLEDRRLLTNGCGRKWPEARMFVRASVAREETVERNDDSDPF